MKNTVRSVHVAFHFISFYSFVLTFAMHRNMLIVSHWNILIFCDQWKMMSDLNMSHRKISHFVSLTLFAFTLFVIKLKNFHFESHWNILIFLIKKDMTSDFNMSHRKKLSKLSFFKEKYLIFFHFLYLGSL